MSHALPDAEATQRFGRALAGVLRAGDLVVLTGDLGAGKTTLVQGLGEGLGVRGPITSPTFVLARLHPSLVGGPALVHVDAYRLGSAQELETLDLESDLDTDIAAAVVVVEWGRDLVEQLTDSHLRVVIDRDAQPRSAMISAHGPAWVGRSEALEASVRAALSQA